MMESLERQGPVYKNFPKNTDITSHVGPYLLMIKRGFVLAYQNGRQGNSINFGILKPGDFVYPTVAFDQKRNAFRFQALTTLETMFLPIQKVISRLAQDSEFLLSIQNQISRDSYDFLTRMTGVFAGNTEIKIIDFLVYLAKRFSYEENGQTHIQVPLTHKDIAAFIGSSRERTTMCLSRLKKEGVLEVTNNLITIKDYAWLARRSNLTFED